MVYTVHGHYTYNCTLTKIYFEKQMMHGKLRMSVLQKVVIHVYKIHLALPIHTDSTVSH